MVNTPEQAIANAARKNRPGLFGVGTCLQQVRTCYGVAARFPSASKAWAGAADKHSVARSDVNSIPRGVPVLWVGGSHGFGHIAISLGHGLCETTDFVNRGGFGVAHIDDITRVWGLTFMGWTEDINGVRVWTPPAPPAPVPVPRKEPHGNHVTAGWALVREGIAELRKASKTRKAIHARADELAAVVKKGPSK